MISTIIDEDYIINHTEMESDYIIERRARMLGLSAPKEDKKQTYIKPASQKRQKQNREYSKVRKQFLVEYPRCQAKGCNQVSTQVHHQCGRIGNLLTDTRYFMAVCAEHHTEIENHPEIAKEQGYSLSRLKK